MGSNFPPRRNSTSSSPRSPLPAGSPSPGLHFSKYKLEDILEQFKNSGNSSTNNHNHLPLPANAALLANQSSSSIPHNLSLALDKVGSAKAGVGSSGSLGPLGFGSSGLPLGVFLNHHQSRPPHPTSFPASSLLSAAAKAQLASQTTQGQGSHAGSNPVSAAGPLELLKETQQQQQQQQQLQLQQQQLQLQQQQSSKVKNSTLHHNPPPSSISASRHPSPHSAFLFPPSHPLAQSLVASAHHFPPAVERSASHRKRHRQSPTVLSMLRETQQLANGPRKTPPGDTLSTAIINLSTSSSSVSFPPSSHPSSTSATHHNNAIALENHYHLPSGQIPPRLPTAARQIAPNTGHPRQMEALDFTTGLTANAGPPLALDPPTQPLSALLHLLSVQNAQASAAATISASAQLGSLAAGGGRGSKRQSPRPLLSPPPAKTSSHGPRSLKTQSPSRAGSTTPLPTTATPPPPSSPSQTHSTRSSPVQRLCSPSNPHSPRSRTSPSPSASEQQQRRPSPGHLRALGSLSRAPSRESLGLPVSMTTHAADVQAPGEQTYSQGSGALTATPTSPKPLDLSNHVLNLLAASSTSPQVEQSSSNRNHSTGEQCLCFITLAKHLLFSKDAWKAMFSEEQDELYLVLLLILLEIIFHHIFNVLCFLV